MSINQVMKKAAQKLKVALKKELQKQGHRNTGALESSFQDKVYMNYNSTGVEGFALHYFKFLNDGVPAASASWKQMPFLIKYFESKGLENEEAERAAAATIVVWKKEGMPTEASKRFSKTGNRKEFIDIVRDLIDTETDKLILEGIDEEIHKEYQKTKSETI